MSGRLEIPSAPVELPLVWLAAACELRTPGGQIVAAVPQDVTITRSGCAALVVAWMRKGQPLTWSEAVAALRDRA